MSAPLLAYKEDLTRGLMFYLIYLKSWWKEISLFRNEFNKFKNTKA